MSAVLWCWSQELCQRDGSASVALRKLSVLFGRRIRASPAAKPYLAPLSLAYQTTFHFPAFFNRRGLRASWSVFDNPRDNRVIRSHGPRSVSAVLSLHSAPCRNTLTSLDSLSPVYSKTYSVPRRRKYMIPPSRRRKPRRQSNAVLTISTQLSSPLVC